MTTQRPLHEQDDELKVPALLDADPVSDAPWPLPPVKPWEPKPPSVFQDLMERVGL